MNNELNNFNSEMGKIRKGNFMKRNFDQDSKMDLHLEESKEKAKEHCNTLIHVLGELLKPFNSSGINSYLCY